MEFEWREALASAKTPDDMPRIMAVITHIRAGLERAASIVPASKLEAIQKLMRTPLPPATWNFRQFRQSAPNCEEQSSSSISSEQKQNKDLPDVPKDKHKGSLSRIPVDQGTKFRENHFGRHWGLPVDTSEAKELPGVTPDVVAAIAGEIAADLLPEFSALTIDSEMEKYHA